MLNKPLVKQTLVAILLSRPPALGRSAAARWSRSADFRDWRLDCPAAPARRTPPSRARTAARCCGWPCGPGRPPALAVTTPLPLFLPDGAGAQHRAATAAARGAWRTCGAGGCEATLPLDPELLGILKRERAGSVGFTLVDGVRVRIPFSLMGLSAALAARGD